jgi:hypothetical protein
VGGLRELVAKGPSATVVQGRAEVRRPMNQRLTAEREVVLAAAVPSGVAARLHRSIPLMVGTKRSAEAHQSGRGSGPARPWTSDEARQGPPPIPKEMDRE